jgi:hypothetical protein
MPGVATAGGCETLGQIDLVAIASLNIRLYPVEGGPVLLRAKVGSKIAIQPEVRLADYGWLA